MEAKDILKSIQDKGNIWEAGYSALKQQAEMFLKGVINDVKAISGEVPDEKTLFEIIRQYFDQKTNAGVIEKFNKMNLGILNPIKNAVVAVIMAIKGWGETQILKFVDVQILDRFLGKDWYEKLIKQINNVK